MPPQHNITERGPLQHGSTYRGYRLDERLINLVFLLEASAGDLASMYDQRAPLLDLFKPSRDLKLRFDLPNGKTRQIDIRYNSDMSMPWRVDDWAHQKFAITLKATDPTFYDPVINSVSLNLSAGGTPWAIPWAIGWTIGGSTLNQVTPITYTGSFLSYPVIQIVGPITDAVMTNEATGDKLDFTGTTIGAGHYYTIDCRYGQKTVIDDLAVDQIGKLTSGSNLATFHIADDEEAPGGINSIRLAGTGASTTTQGYLQFYTRYIGL
jgi:hypothetical protein